MVAGVTQNQLSGYCCYVTQCTLPALYHKATFSNLVALGIFMRFLSVHKQGSSNLFYERRLFFFKEKIGLLLNLKGERFEELRDSSRNADCREAEDRMSNGFLAAKTSSSFFWKVLEKMLATECMKPPSHKT